MLLDDYQRAGSAPIDVHALGVDFMATGCLTYMSRRVRPGGVGREVRGQDASRGDAMRVSFHAYNNEQDVEAAMDALRAEEALLTRVDARVGPDRPSLLVRRGASTKRSSAPPRSRSARLLTGRIVVTMISVV